MVLGGQHDSRENKTNCFPRDLTLNSINKKIGKLQNIWAVVWGEAISILILVDPADLVARILSNEIKNQRRFLTGCLVSAR